MLKGFDNLMTPTTSLNVAYLKKKNVSTEKNPLMTTIMENFFVSLNISTGFAERNKK